MQNYKLIKLISCNPHGTGFVPDCGCLTLRVRWSKLWDYSLIQQPVGWNQVVSLKPTALILDVHWPEAQMLEKHG